MGYILDLKNEITNDMQALGYAGVALPVDSGTYPTISDRVNQDPAQQTINQVIADLLNSSTTNRTQAVTSLTKDQVLNAMDSGELALVDAVNAAKLGWILTDSIDPFNSSVVQIFKDAFGQPSTTLTALNGLRNKTVSRATEIGLREVKQGHVAMARLL